MFGKVKRDSAYTLIFTVIIIFVIGCLPGLCVGAHRPKSSAAIVKSERMPPPAILNAYLQEIKSHIEHVWSAAKGSNEHATVAFRVGKDGRAYWIELTDASAVEAVNDSAQDAIFYASPFPPLPSGFGDHLDLAVDFNSNYQPLCRLGYSRPIESNSSSSRRLLANAVTYSKEGKVDSAIDALKKARELTPFDVRVRDKLTEAYVQSAQGKQNDLAISFLHQALLNDHNNSQAREKLNQLITESGKDPESFAVRVTLAQEYAKSSQYDDAVSEYGEAWLLKKDPQLIAEINTTSERRHKYADVQKWQAVLENHEGAENHMALAQAYEACGDTDKALKEYRTASYTDSANGAAERAMKELEAKRKAGASETNVTSPELALSDEFPYANFGSRSITVRTIKDRKVSVDYLHEACPKMITRWATNRVPLKVYLENDTGVVGYRPQFRQFMIDAFATWVKASEGRLSFSIVDSPNRGNIICRWVSDPSKGHMSGCEQGITHSQVFYLKSAPNNCMVRSAEIYILTLYRGNNAQLSDVAMKAVCLHELGHALGISGHSPYRGDMMYATFSPYDIPLRLTDRDAGTIKLLYQGYLHPHSP